MSQTRASGSRLSWELAFALAYVLAIFVVGSLPGAPQVTRGVSDKLQHALGFALLAWLWCRALGRLRLQRSTAWQALGGFLVSTGVGAALELWQGLLTYRTCEFLDWVADGVGAGLAAALYIAVQRVFGASARATE